MEKVIDTKIFRGRGSQYTEKEQSEILLNTNMLSIDTEHGAMYIFTMPMRQCNNCNKVRYLAPLYKCREVYYCSTQCQSHDWSNHKIICKPLETRRIDDLIDKICNDVKYTMAFLGLIQMRETGCFSIKFNIEDLEVFLDKIILYKDNKDAESINQLCSEVKKNIGLCEDINMDPGKNNNYLTRKTKLIINIGDFTIERYIIYVLSGNGSISFATPEEIDQMGNKIYREDKIKSIINNKTNSRRKK